MIPLRDINPTQRVPYVTYLIITLNLLVFAYQFLLLDQRQNQLFVERHGVVPYYLLSGYGPSLSTPFSSMFMHGGFFHLLSNMWFLHIFGDNVEDALGHVRFVVFYLITGIAAVLAHALIDPASRVPLVGASGAISGVLGAYLMLYPKARVLALVPLFIFFFTQEIPAFFFILFWFVIQVMSGFGSLAQAQSTGVAFFAHVGGFVAGVVCLLLFGRPSGPKTYLGPRMPTHRGGRSRGRW